MNITKLKKLKDQWVKILRLQDWDIELTFAENPTELENSCYGFTKANYDYKKAKIIINRLEWMNSDLALNTDLEVTLIHELLHLRFPKMTLSDSVDEEGIERVAEALHKLKYSGDKID